MTVTYTGEVATCTGLGCFWKLLFRWRGSIYKLLWPNLVVYSVLYFTLSGTYRFLLNNEQRTLFEKMALHCQTYGDLIPVSFVLGFYVSLVIKRWWDQYLCLPWPDNLALFVSSLVHGQDERGRMMRRTIMRYVNLSLLLTLRMISPRVKKRFPTLDHVVEAGWMLPGEKKIFEDLEQKTIHAKYWMPLVWAGGIVTRARKESRIKDDFALKTLIDELNIFRAGCGGMLNYDWISIPLVYTQVGAWLQVVTLAVYVFFLATLMGNQFLDPGKGYEKHQVDLVLPIFTFLQFFFYMGWLKVAESLVNPFGEDDDDFELNWLLDRNLQISYVIVDEMHQEHPEMLKDQYWDEVFPVELPYTAASKQYQTGPPQYSAEEVEVPLNQAEFMPLDSVVEERDEEPESDSQDIDLEIEHPSVQRGETHPMKIRRRSRTSSTGTSGSGNSTSFSKGRSSVLNMLSRIFHHDDHSKDDTAHLGSSMSLRSRRANRSTSRVSSVSHSIAPSRCSFVRDNTQDNDYQEEVFSMSDLDIPDSGRLLDTPGDDALEDKNKIHAEPSLNASQCSVLTSVYKGSLPNDDQETPTPNEFSPESQKKERHQTTERKELQSPTRVFSNDSMMRHDPKARIILQAHSPVYHVFSPSLAKTSFHESTKIDLKGVQNDADDVQTSSQFTGSDRKNNMDSVITIMPPSQVQRFNVTPTAMSIEECKLDFGERLRKTPSAEKMFPPATEKLQPCYSDYFTQPHFQLESPMYSKIPVSPNYATVPAPVRSQSNLFEPTKSVSETVRISPSQTQKESQVFFSEQTELILPLENSHGDDLQKPNDIEPAVKTTDSIIPIPPPLLESVLSMPEIGEVDQHPALDPNTPSAAIPVPAMSPAHVNPSPDLDISRRQLMHELEPIIEHKDEGTASLSSSIELPTAEKTTEAS